MERKKIGDFFVERKILTPEQKDHILDFSRQTGKSFGEAALELEILTRDDMVEVFGPGFEIDFFYLDPRYFPAVTKDTLTIDEILRFGALPLGFKRSGFLSQKKHVNVGVLNPSDTKAMGELRSILLNRLEKEGVTDIKVFLILSDQYLDVLRMFYATERQQVAARDPNALDEVLRLYLSQ